MGATNTRFGASQCDLTPPAISVHLVNENYGFDVVPAEITENYSPWMLIQRPACNPDRFTWGSDRVEDFDRAHAP